MATIRTHYDHATDEVILIIPAHMPMIQIIGQLIRVIMQGWNTE